MADFSSFPTPDPWASLAPKIFARAAFVAADACWITFSGVFSGTVSGTFSGTDSAAFSASSLGRTSSESAVVKTSSSASETTSSTITSFTSGAAFISGTIVSSVVACIEGASVKLLPGSVFPKAMSMPFSGGGSRYLRPAKKRSISTANRIKAVVQKDFFSYVVCKNAINLALLQGLP